MRRREGSTTATTDDIYLGPETRPSSWCPWSCAERSNPSQNVNWAVCDPLCTSTAGQGSRAALEHACKAAEEGAAATKSMEAGAGRSTYVPEHVLRDVPDPGAQAVCVWLNALLKVVQ